MHYYTHDIVHSTARVPDIVCRHFAFSIKQSCPSTIYRTAWLSIRRVYMYIYLQYHGKYTKDIGTTVYILDSF